MITKIFSITVSVAVVGALFGFITVFWSAFSFPSFTGFTDYIIPALVGLHDIPIIGTLLSIVLWVVSFEISMFVTRIVFWLPGLFGVGSGDAGPVR